jgi:hypothetical protein
MRPVGQCLAMLITGALISPPILCRAQSAGASLQRMIVTGQTSPGGYSAYGAPEAFSRSRLGALTQSYVLPPFTVYAGFEYELTSPRHGLPDNLFTQELEVGLPYRLGVAVENNVDAFSGSTREGSTSFEMRYAHRERLWSKVLSDTSKWMLRTSQCQSETQIPRSDFRSVSGMPLISALSGPANCLRCVLRLRSLGIKYLCRSCLLDLLDFGHDCLGLLRAECLTVRRMSDVPTHLLPGIRTPE